MKEKYDFGERKVTIKSDNLQENTELKEQYDFVTEAGNIWATAAKNALGVANTSYTGNMLRGAGAGAAVGAVGNVAKNMVKRDDDPTKKGFFGSLTSGAVKGAGAGATVGAGARFVARSSLGKHGINYMSQQAIQSAKASGVHGAVGKTIDTINSGSKNLYMNRNMLGVNRAGDFVRATGSQLNKVAPGASRAERMAAALKNNTDFNGSQAKTIISNS